MCAGRCREPRCIRSPCRGSQRLRRALGGTRILLAAAPTAPPCFCRWQRSSLLHRGFFPRRTIRRVDAVRIHPHENPNLLQTENRQRISTLTGLFMGAGGFEPPKLKSSRFTVCPHWPLGNTPRFCSRPLPDDLFILSDCGRFVNYFFRIFAAFLRKLSAGSVLGQMFPALVIPQGGNGFAGHGV